MARPAIAEINLNHIQANFALASSLAPQDQTVAVIKADAYGHGAIAVAKALADQAPMFAVACIEEALELRAGGITHPILLLEGFFDSCELETIANQGFSTAIHCLEQVQALAKSRLATPLEVWLKIDTGMHRLGFSPQQALVAYQQLVSLPQVKKVVVMSHFANADNHLAESVTVIDQLAALPAELLQPEIELSLANSAGILAHANTRKNWQRSGIMLYGASPLSQETPESVQLQAAMTLKSQIIATRWIEAGEQVGYGGRFTANQRTKVGTVAMGYADGYPRHAATGTPVLVNGQRSKIIGRVSMDMLTVDLTDITDAELGSKVILWGEGLPANEVATHCNTIAYDLFTGVSRRVPRLYKN